MSNMKKLILLIIPIIFIFYSCDKDESEEIIIEEELILPELLTNQASNLTVYSVILRGKVLNIGNSELTEQGLLIGHSPNPTIENNINKLNLPINEGNEFSIELIELEQGATYYVKAYAINSDGTGYGNEIQFTALNEKVFEGDVTLSTQEQVNIFGANNYQTIKGSLTIEGTVTDLKPLKDLVFVNYELNIKGTTALKNFDGLQNLKFVGRHLVIDNNTSLENFLGITNLGELPILEVIRNPKIKNLKGFDSLYKIGTLGIGLNDNLENLIGLESLLLIYNNLAIDSNPKIFNLQGLNSLSIIRGSTYIGENPSLTNLNGLENMVDLDYLYLNNNESLLHIDALKTLNTFNALKIDGCNALTQLPVFKSITVMSSIEIRYGGGLTSLEGFKNLKSVRNLLFLQSDILSLEGLENLEYIDNKFELISCDNLIDFKGFENVKSIGSGSFYSGLTINENQNLISLNGLQGLTEVNGSLNITTNKSLTSFDGLQNLKSIKKTMHLIQNESLNDINAIAGITTLNGFVLEGSNNLTQLPVFNNLTQLDYIFIAYGGGLTNLQGFNKLQFVEEITLEESNITTLEGLERLEKIGKILKIQRCDNMLNLEGLTNVKSIGNGFSDQGLSINYNRKIKNLTGLNKLAQINGTLEIRGNEFLESLNGLESISMIDKNIEIYGNSELSNFCSLASYFTKNSYKGNYIVENNFRNPSIQDLIDGNCN